MRNMLIWLAAAWLLAATAGCPPPPPESAALGPKTHVASRSGVTVELILPGYSFYRGQELPIEVIVANGGAAEAVFRADSGSPAYVTLWRRTKGGWDKFRRFPEAVVGLPGIWSLPAGQSRRFPLNLHVGPDWPTYEPLKLTAEINGLPGVAPSALIDVYATRGEYDKAMGAENSE